MSKSRNNAPQAGRVTNRTGSPIRRGLIVNADDFGLSAEVNAGVVEAHRRGILTSTTIMANAPAFAEAVELARDNPGLGVGLHLNLVRGKPLSTPERVPLLVDRSGRLRPFRWRRLTPDFLAQAEDEYRRQFEKSLSAGLHPTHIDFEKHHAWQGGLYDLACRLAMEYGVGAARNLREPVAWSLATIAWPGWRRLAMSVFLRSGVAIFGGGSEILRTPDRLLGQMRIGCLDENAWLAILNNLPPGISEVMTHPGKNPAAEAETGETGRSWIEGARAAELSALVSPRVAEALARSAIELMTFKEC